MIGTSYNPACRAAWYRRSPETIQNLSYQHECVVILLHGRSHPPGLRTRKGLEFPVVSKLNERYATRVDRIEFSTRVDTPDDAAALRRILRDLA